MIGRPVAQAAAAAGFAVTVASRRAPLSGETPGWMELDVLQPASIARLRDAFEYLVVILPSGPTFEDCFRVEAGGAQNIAAAFKGSALARLIYISGASNLREDHPFPPARAKHQAEEAIKRSGVPYTIWRCGWFLETLDKLYRFVIIGVPGGGASMARWLSAGDFGGMLARSLANPEAAGKTLYAFGPEPLTLREAANRFRNALHHFAPIVSMPLPLMIGAAKLLGAREAWFGAQMMRFLEVEPEFGDPTEAIAIAGAPTETIEVWLERRKRSITQG